MPLWEYDAGMARAAVTADVFNAIAEPRRREIIDVLARGGSQAVGAVVTRVGLPQPVVSKHLGVLREVGIVTVSRDGRRRLYRLEAAALRPVHEWTGTFEQHWRGQLDRIKRRAEQASGKRGAAKAGAERAGESDPLTTGKDKRS